MQSNNLEVSEYCPDLQPSEMASLTEAWQIHVSDPAVQIEHFAFL